MARMGAELRKQDFVKATVKVIAEHGVANATTRRIAAAAGCPLASLHYVFRTKDELFYAVYESLFSQPQAYLQQATSAASPAAAVTAMLRRTIHWASSNPDVARAQSELFFWASRNQPDMARKIYSVGVEATEQVLERVLGNCLDAAGLQATSRTLVLLFDGLLVAWTAHGDLERLGRETETACQALSLLVEHLQHSQGADTQNDTE
ncbi:TetR/AcrR family transcriptional regulator [Pseudomonas mosselii]|uniref:TetR/AcrR family transcriptional regulator n=1 Tax=Pseudomonas mosselii TaxID=78327 RepID=UPI001552DCD9|nr:TetR/AcrR family transcriptional regulator [Pseudomonas mosselii]MDH1658429.1 TetR/AcrR family transcriptional regulator [Pseudomonas mosselii]MDH1718255.1 TetR/AcrR family transcriptional regulator [Pseudomonas mosselii]MDH1723894.1 TetR/AcrR family transcriptional regulator [Pseudomonas mosselii]MDN4497338.1 TetR/AcrR family transcriptional regulator [Pseudomonas mosselii]